MLVRPRSQTISLAITDPNGGGLTSYKPDRIDYFSYLTPASATSTTAVRPHRPTSVKTCAGTEQRSEYVTTARIDALHKVLFGGSAESAPPPGRCSSAAIPHDAQWVKRAWPRTATTSAYTPLLLAADDAPVRERHVDAGRPTDQRRDEPAAAAACRRGRERPGGRHLPARHWASTEAPVAGGCYDPAVTAAAEERGNAGVLMPTTVADRFDVRVAVCARHGEANCQRYPDGSTAGRPAPCW
jgi:hypothetical protein